MLPVMSVQRWYTASRHVYKNDIFQCFSRITLSVFLLFFIAGCERAPDTLEKIQADGVIRVITRNGPTTYFHDKDGLTGFEYSLLQEFAKELDVELDIHTEHSLDSLVNRASLGGFHLAAAGLTPTPERNKLLLFSAPYFSITEQLVYRQGENRPRKVSDIENARIAVQSGSSHAERLRELSASFPGLQWTEHDDLEPLDLVEMLDRGEIDYTVVDSNFMLINRGLFPGLRIGFDLSEPEELAWALPKSERGSRFEAAINQFFDRIKSDGTLIRLREYYYGHADDVEAIGTYTFARNVNRLLPKYETQIREVAQEFGLDWRLLAAISYQESHWNPKAKSRTGVRGMMMLTLPTAKEMGVKNRLDPLQSLRGGAKYFLKIRSRLPERIQEPDRSWFALAAYNVGRGHLEDARIITQRQGKDPDRWTDVAEHLPLLAKRRWYSKARHGYARGYEPVTYVQNIRHYYSYLVWEEMARNRVKPQQKVKGESDIAQYVPEALNKSLGTL